jgi:DNA-binding beta-propeller fold protein YncE
MVRRASVLALLAVLAGCGGADLPPTPGPPHSPPLTRRPEGTVVRNGPSAPATTDATLHRGRVLAVLRARERRLELVDVGTGRRLASAPVGVGPTHVACLDGGPCYVADTTGEALLVVRSRPLRVVRRVQLPSPPYGLALDQQRRRLWITLPRENAVAELPAHGRPHVLAVHPTVRQPDAVRVDSATGMVTVFGRDDGVIERLPAPTRPAARG